MPGPRYLAQAWVRGALALACAASLSLATCATASALPSNCLRSESTVSCTFEYAGAEQQFVVPANVSSVSVSAIGGEGGASNLNLLGDFASGAGGQPGAASAPVHVFTGEVLYVEVGGIGQPSTGGAWNGGGGGGPQSVWSWYPGAGGGASDVRTLSCSSSCASGGQPPSLYSRIVVAGGGGGGGEVGESEGYDEETLGGNGGAAEAAGGAGENAGAGDALGGEGGAPGTATGVGEGGTKGTSAATEHNGTDGAPGAFAHGGPGGAAYRFGPFTVSSGNGGGGGGGYYGGGGGGGGAKPEMNNFGSAGGGGGGGSSYAPGGTTSVAAPGTPPSVTISYRVPLMAVASAPLTFATQPQGTVSAPQSVTVTNEGGGPLVLSALTFAGADPGDFLLASDGCLSELEPGESCELTIGFAPQAPSARTATLQIAGNDPRGPASVPLEGIGGALPHGADGASGAVGATGPTGPAGPAGPSSPTGPTHVAFITCRARAATVPTHGRVHLSRRLRCVETGASAAARPLRSDARASHATLLRGRHVYAAGLGVLLRSGAAELVLSTRATLGPGSYKLVLVHRHGSHNFTVSEPITIGS